MKNRILLAFLALLFSTTSLLSVSCNGFTDYSKADAQKYLPGLYTYTVPSGETQVLEVNKNFGFHQILYSKDRKIILYENRGTMYVKGEDLEFKDWLECYELAEAKLVSRPKIVYSTGSFWRKPTNEHDVQIIKFDQTNYIFTKQ